MSNFEMMENYEQSICAFVLPIYKIKDAGLIIWYIHMTWLEQNTYQHLTLQ